MSGEDDAERLRNALVTIEGWAKAYPQNTFSPVTDAEWKAVSAALAAIHPTLMDRLHAHWGRHLLGGIGILAREALEP